MDKQDIKQIKRLLKDEFSENNKKLDQKLKDNNKTLKKEIIGEVNQKIEEKIDDLAMIVNKSIGDSEERVNGRLGSVDNKLGIMKNKLGIMENKLGTMEKDIKEVKEMGNKIYKNMSAVDDQIVELQIDADKAKYIHREEWNKLPPPHEISRVLAEKGLKAKTGKR